MAFLLLDAPSFPQINKSTPCINVLKEKNMLKGNVYEN